MQYTDTKEHRIISRYDYLESLLENLKREFIVIEKELKAISPWDKKEEKS